MQAFTHIFLKKISFLRFNSPNCCTFAPAMDNEIRHEGIVEAVSDSLVKVKILQVSACNGCKVASHCRTADAKEKIVDVDVARSPHQWEIGQHVVVSIQSVMVGRALLIGFGFPLMLMLATLVISRLVGCSEGLSALLMLLSLIPYYIIVWMCRDSIARQVTFRLEDPNEYKIK